MVPVVPMVPMVPMVFYQPKLCLQQAFFRTALFHLNLGELATYAFLQHDSPGPRMYPVLSSSS